MNESDLARHLRVASDRVAGGSHPTTADFKVLVTRRRRLVAVTAISTGAVLAVAGASLVLNIANSGEPSTGVHAEADVAGEPGQTEQPADREEDADLAPDCNRPATYFVDSFGASASASANEAASVLLKREQGSDVAIQLDEDLGVATVAILDPQGRVFVNAAVAKTEDGWSVTRITRC